LIDIKTVFVCIMHISLFYAAAYTVFWFSQKTYKGFGCWTLANLSYSGIYGAVLLRLVISDGASIAAVAVLTPLSAMLYADGVLRFTQNNPLPRSAYLVLVPVVPAALYFYYGTDWFAMRTAILLAAITPFNFITCWRLATFQTDTGKVLYRIGGAFFVMRYVGLAFGTVMLFFGRANMRIFESPDTGAYLLFTMLGVLGAGVFFFLLHAQRAQEERDDAQRTVANMLKAAQGLAQ